MAWAEADTSKAQLTLKWKKSTNDSSFTIFRKLKSDRTWPFLPMASLPSTASQYLDSTIVIGSAYEYRIRRKAGNIFSESYLFGGVKVKEVEYRKTILLLVDERIRSGILAELSTLKEDLLNETWNVQELVIPTDKTAVEVREMIFEFYDKNPELTTLFIIGHVAVPYSGNTRWDGHADHEGAWVCDNYYADINGNWTDEFVNNTSPSRNENKNIPNDGKFDDDVIPSDLEFEVGRVDFYNMPAFSKTEIQLLKNYLTKDHLHRIAKTRAVRRALVQDNFDFPNEFFGSSGYKNYTVLVGPDSVKTDVFRDQLLQKSYLLAYGAGAGSYQSAGGISTTSNMASDSLRAVFTFLFGSYFGDWDVQNNFLRSSLGSGSILTCAWAGRPSWYIQHMSMGETIGYSTLVTNNSQTIYSGNPFFSAYRPAHVSLLGDPSLTLIPVIPPTGLMATEDKGAVNLNWSPSTEATEGYGILRRINPNGKWEPVAYNIKSTSYIDQCQNKNIPIEYLVYAIKLDKNASGTFYNRSAGIRVSIILKNSQATRANFTYTADYEFITFKARSSNATSHEWKVLGKDYAGDSITIQFPCQPQGYTITLTAKGQCNTDQSDAVIFDYLCSVPQLIQYSINPEIKCFGDVTDIKLDSLTGADPFTFLWNNGTSINPVKNVSGKVSVEVTSRLGTKNIFEITLPNFPKLNIDKIDVKNVNPGFNLGSVTTVNTSGGVPPYSFKVLNLDRLDSLPVGIYTLEVTDANGCKTTKSFEIKMNVSTKNLNETVFKVYPNPANQELYLNSEIEISKLEFIHSEGKSILNQQFQPLGNRQYKVDIHLLPSAYYLIKINGNETGVSFIKQ